MFAFADCRQLQFGGAEAVLLTLSIEQLQCISPSYLKHVATDLPTPGTLEKAAKWPERLMCMIDQELGAKGFKNTKSGVKVET